MIPVTTRRRLVAKPRTPHLIPQAAQLFKLPARNVGGRGERPSSFSGGYKGGILFEKRIPPLPGSSAKSCTNSCSAVGAATPRPLVRGDQKGYPLREENTPFFWQQRKELHELMQRRWRCNHPPPRREIKRDTLFEKRIPPFSGSSAKSCTIYAAPLALQPPSPAREIPPPSQGKSKSPPSPGKGEQQKGASCEAPFFNQISRRSRRSY